MIPDPALGIWQDIQARPQNSPTCENPAEQRFVIPCSEQKYRADHGDLAKAKAGRTCRE